MAFLDGLFKFGSLPGRHLFCFQVFTVFESGDMESTP